MSFLASMIVFLVSSLVAAGVTVLTFNLFTRNLGPAALGALMFWPIWLLIYFCTGATIIWLYAPNYCIWLLTLAT